MYGAHAGTNAKGTHMASSRPAGVQGFGFYNGPALSRQRDVAAAQLTSGAKGREVSALMSIIFQSALS